MATTTAVSSDAPRAVVVVRPRSDRVFRAVAKAAGCSSLVVMGLIATFLLLQALPAFRLAGLDFLRVFEWAPDADPARFGVAAVLAGTFIVAGIALAVAVPVAVAAALFVTEVAPRRLRRPLTSLLDLVAAVPSLVYGIWGLAFLQPRLFGFARWLSTYADGIPIFDADQEVFAGSMFVCGIVVSLMVVPIIASVVREVCSQAPQIEREGALALGSTRWGVVRTVVLPFARGGIVGGAMLGLGRALGETIAITLIISPSFTITPKILDPGGGTIASLIALEFPEASRRGIEALMAAGLTLFAVTLVVNMAAAAIVKRSRAGAGTDL